MSKFELQVVDKPVAIISAFQGGRSLADNRKMNRALADDLERLSLGFFPVKGAGQEVRRWLFGLFPWMEPSSEESFVVQPRGDVSEADFESAIRSLVQKYGQYGAAVKVPSTPQAFVLRQHGRGENLGSSAGPTTVQDNYYTQLKGGPRATLDMLRPWEIHGERKPVGRFVNWLKGRSFMNMPADRTRIGQRFFIKDLPPS